MLKADMDIWYFCLDPHFSYGAPHHAPSIHIRETVHSLESLGHRVQHFLYGDNLTGLDKWLRQSKKSGQATKVSGTTAKPSALAPLKPLLRDVYELYRNAFVDRSMVNEVLRSNNMDFIYERLFESKSSVTVCAQQQGIPLILESNSTTRERKQYWGSPLAPLVHRVELEALQRATAVTVISTPLKRYYEQQGIPAEKITVLPNGVNELNFSLENITQDVRSELSLQDRLVLGFVGNIHPYHGIELFLPMARSLTVRHKEIHFLLVGAGPGLSDLVQALSQEGLDQYFTFAGQVPHAEVPNQIAAMDICLLPRSDWLNSPMKLLEYGVMGKAIVAPDLEAIRDILQHGETAYLVESGNLGALTSAIEELVSNSLLRTKLATNVKQHILMNHTWTRNAEKIIGIYHQIIGVPAVTQTIATKPQPVESV